MIPRRIFGALCLALVCQGCSIMAAKKIIDKLEEPSAPVYNITYECPAMMPQTVLETVREYIIIDAEMDRHFETCDLEVDCFRP